MTRTARHGLTQLVLVLSMISLAVVGCARVAGPSSRQARLPSQAGFPARLGPGGAVPWVNAPAVSADFEPPTAPIPPATGPACPEAQLSAVLSRWIPDTTGHVHDDSHAGTVRRPNRRQQPGFRPRGIYRGAVTGALLTQELADAFACDGVVCVRQALDTREVADAVRAIDAVLASPGPLAQVASGTDDPGSFTEDFRRWREIGQIEKLARNSRLPQLAAELMSTPQVRFYHDHVLVKEGGTRQRTPWHQDQPYYNVDGPGVSAWIPVDPVPEAGCLELVAGTHRGPWLMPRTFLAGEAKWFPEGSLAELPDIEADREAFDIRRFDLQPGDAIFFDFLTVHGAPGFPYPGRRRVLSLRYLSAAARHAPRRWRTSPPFDGLDAELPSGAVMDHPLFPVVWPR